MQLSNTTTLWSFKASSLLIANMSLLEIYGEVYIRFKKMITFAKFEL